MRFLYAISDLCNGCLLCQAICSFHRYRSFNPKKSLIKVLKIEEEGEYIPLTIACDFSCLNNNVNADTVPCAELCPTGALIYGDLNEVYNKLFTYKRNKSKQPVFRVIAPWKYPYPVRTHD